MAEMFHFFPRLPLELRIQIWGLAYKQDRVVRVRQRRLRYPRTEHYWSSTTPVAAITRASQESRRYCSYQKAFTGTDASGARYIWVDFSSDIIQIHSNLVPGLIAADGVEKREIQHLRLELMADLGGKSVEEDPEWFFHFHSHKIRDFPRLHYCDILVNDGLRNWAMFIAESFWSPSCPKEHVRMVDAKTGEWIDIVTSRPWVDWIETHGGEYREFCTDSGWNAEIEAEEFEDRWEEMMTIGSKPLPRIDLRY
ncbi:hypothetical protein FB567DRAFT_113089 [Paraphoma chrysanthemicola]|uniref:2EXR domain-containing protein n=1 Tax=Paraphoma chrysanthemicola TaxID=798071 RepID=A0A8K0VW80_9PLEO|nr:hypothetical protein FB567DRAFT_113089 [Paraphoma chrysanthemicola]